MVLKKDLIPNYGHVGCWREVRIIQTDQFGLALILQICDTFEKRNTLSIWPLCRFLLVSKVVEFLPEPLATCVVSEMEASVRIFPKKTSCKEIKWFPWNYWPFITNNAIAITSVLLHQYNGFDVPKMRERERKRFVKKMKDKHNSNTKHLIAYSIQLLLSIFFFALSWRSLAMTHAVNTPGSQLISFWVNNSVCKLII